MGLLLSHSSIAEVASYWNAVPHERIPASNHLIYEVSINDKPHIMRLTAATHRTHRCILAEIDWINYLSGKANVAIAIASQNNGWAIPLQLDGREMTACMFEKVTGRSLNNKAAWGSKVFFEWGRAMAGLHELSRKYADGSRAERQLNGQVLLEMAAATVGRHTLEYKVLEEKCRQIEAIHAADWGMIHCDLTQANMCFLNNRLYVFDFDNCQVAPFLYDIAITIYVTLFDIKKRGAPAREADIFLRSFFKGYSSQGNLKIQAALLKCLLNFFNALVCISCSRAGQHPLQEYAYYNLHHGTLADIAFEKHLH